MSAAIEKGARLWYASDSQREDREVVVATVGRKWVTTVCGLRFDKVTRRVDGGNYTSPGVVVDSREAIEAARERNRLWFVLRYRMDTMSCPQDVTAVDILEAAKRLRVVLPKS